MITQEYLKDNGFPVDFPIKTGKIKKVIKHLHKKERPDFVKRTLEDINKFYSR